MKTVLFSAVFGAGTRPERMRFLTDVWRAFPEPVRFVAFNTSGVVAEAEFEVVNATRGFKPQVGDPLSYLEKLLIDRFPAKAQLLLDHVQGEFGKNRDLYEANVYKHVRMMLEFERTLDLYQPDYVYLWNQFNAFHRTLAEILTERGIRFGFFHDGVLPGSIAFDVDGEMGESWIAKDPEAFLSVPVTDDDIARATAFVDQLTADDVNRHPQEEQISVEVALEQARLADRPVVFLAGQNDWHAGIKPKSPARAHHSHIFEGSVEALAGLDKVAGELGVSILFKPHPLSRDRFAFLRGDDFPNSVILGSTSMQACLAAADLVATIASQTCYVALLADKPVMMLGKNQITGKGLTYDATDRETLAKVIETGIKDPMKPHRRADFARHVAQLERSYLFDYGLLENAGYYRRGPDAAARLISQSMALPVEEVIARQASAALV